MLARSFAVLVASLVLAACKTPTDLGNECRMFKRNPDGGRALVIRESEIKSAASKDFISFGSSDCDNLTCVRDSEFFRRDGGSDAGNDLDADGGALGPPAMGYCSDKCLEGSTCSSADPNDDNDAKRRLNCRALLLDTATLNALCAAGQCLQGLKSPYFCARGGGADAGT
ncbi:MAG: agmO [Myxococcaceae bacterium]|nr:agmO [Myxococcaceae bacterium]